MQICDGDISICMMWMAHEKEVESLYKLVLKNDLQSKSFEVWHWTSSFYTNHINGIYFGSQLSHFL